MMSMARMRNLWKALLFMQALTGICGQSSSCQFKLFACTKMVRPVLNDVRYMFPTSLSDVDSMCKMWSRFVDCVRRYMSSCSTDDQRSKFNKAVGHSVDTVHAICSSDRHQRDYLESAACFRRVSAESCGRYYRRLVDQVTNQEAGDTHICCAYGQFKGCVSAPLLRNCGMKVHALLDHSLAYLVSTCSSSFYPMSYKCPTAPPPPPEVSRTTTMSSTTPLGNESPTSQVTTWSPRTIISTLPPTQGSRTSGAGTGPGGLVLAVWMTAASSAWISFSS